MRDDDAGEAEQERRAGSGRRSRAGGETGTRPEYSCGRPRDAELLPVSLVESAHACSLPRHPDPLHLAIAYRYYSAFIAAQGDGARRHADDAGAHEVRRRELLPDAAGGCSSATTSRRSPAPARSSARCWRRSSATRPASSGSSPASASPARSTTSITLWASTRRGGRSLAEIARTEIGPVAGIDRRHRRSSSSSSSRSPASASSSSTRSPRAPGARSRSARRSRIAIFMGFYMFVWRKGQIKEATIIGVIADAARRRSSARTSPTRRSATASCCRAHQITLALGHLRRSPPRCCRSGCC